MIDAHTHVLPRMDDGSKSVSMTIKMLRLLKQQDVNEVFATPHFYFDQEGLHDFLARRKRAVEKLSETETFGLAIRLGAEMRWYPGMSRTEGIEQMLIEGTRLLLVEMPFSEWNDQMLNELRGLQNRGINPILAHVDRYACFRKKRILSELNEMGLYLQVNADVMDGLLGSVRFKWMMENRMVQFLGSDCHNVTDRKPNLKRTVEKLCRDCGKQVWDDFVLINEDLVGGR